YGSWRGQTASTILPRVAACLRASPSTRASSPSLMNGWEAARRRAAERPGSMDVDYIPTEITHLPGALGLSRAPGLLRMLGDDLDDLVARHPDLVLVPLVGDVELQVLRITDLAERARERGIELVRFPIADHSVPDSLDDLAVLVERILAFVRAGRAVVLHCW